MGTTRSIAAADALPGRRDALQVPDEHYVLGRSMKPPFPDGSGQIMFGMGCFWGAEKRFWELDGVHVTAVGYAGGYTPNPTYEEVCSGLTGHAEVVLVVYGAPASNLETLLRVFWESHDPTQGMRQGGDIGTQYRSTIYTYTDEQHERAEASRDRYQQNLAQGGRGTITTEIEAAKAFYYAEGYHQQYLAKNPAGYCGLGGTGVCLS